MTVRPNTAAMRTRDFLLENLLYHISAEPLLNSSLVLQGGGALHFIYSSPRYSEDLDFVSPRLSELMPDIQFSLDHLSARFRNSVAPHYQWRSKSDETIFMRFSYTSPLQGEPGIHLEILNHDTEGEESRPAIGKFSPLLVETPVEIYADKVIATLQRMELRGSIKPTDLFDLDYIVKNLEGEATPEKIEAKASSYSHLGWSKKNVEEVMMYIQDPNNFKRFDDSLRRTLMPDVYEHRTFSNEFYENAANHFEKIRHI